jgi:hypothetical protein
MCDTFRVEVKKILIFWVIRLCIPPAFTLVSCLVYSSTLKTEAIYSSEMYVDFQRTQEDSDFRVTDCLKL